MGFMNLYTQYSQAIEQQGRAVGKIIGSSIYLHRTALCTELEQVVSQLCIHFAIDSDDINVVRIERKARNISLLKYESFMEPFPGLMESHTIDVNLESRIQRSYGKNGNCPILHRKELLLSRSHANYQMFERLTQQAESHGLFTNLHKIGYRNYWNALIASKGLHISNHQCIPIAS